MSYLWVNSKTSHVNKCEGDKNAMKLILWHNTRKTGFTPPSMFKLRKSSPWPALYSLQGIVKKPNLRRLP